MWYLIVTTCAFLTMNLAMPTVHSDERTDDKSAVVVELIEPGASPRSEIRFKPKSGDKFKIGMKMKMTQTMTIDGNKLPAPVVPTQKFTIQIVIKDVDSTGEITMEYEYVDFEILDDPKNPSPIAAQIEEMLKPMIGTKGSVVLSNRGVTRKGDIQLTEGIAPRSSRPLKA